MHVINTELLLIPCMHFRASSVDFCSNNLPPTSHYCQSVFFGMVSHLTEGVNLNVNKVAHLYDRLAEPSATCSKISEMATTFSPFSRFSREKYW
jgi:hypothetical protein